MYKELLFYSFIRVITLPLRWMPYSWIHRLAKPIGRIAFYTLTKYRKTTLSNLALAKSLALNNEEVIEIAKQSFENLVINCLEYAKLGVDRNISSMVQWENIQTAEELHAKGKGIIFFCAHQANWEVLFLYGTTRMKGVAIGKETKNKRLYRWILSIRQKHGGKIIPVKNALREGLKALKQGSFLGIVGDQGMPASGFTSPFLGRPAWTSTAPALLAYKTNCPIIFTQIKRVNGTYQMLNSDPIWPDLNKPLEHEIVHMMDKTLTLLQASIKQNPSQWLWQHNRWKQQTPRNIFKEFRQDALCVILPAEPAEFEQMAPHLATLKEIYPTEDFFIITHKNNIPALAVNEIITYEDISETLLEDYRFKLIFNFTSYQKIRPHYLALSAFAVLDIPRLYKLAKAHLQTGHSLSDVLHRALCRPETTWTKEPFHAG